MNKRELVIALARRSKTTRCRLTRPQARIVVDTLFDILEEELTQPEGYLAIEHFGTLKVDRRIRRGRAGRLNVGNTGEMQQPTRVAYHIRFSPSDTLKKKLQENRFKSKYTEE